MERSAYILATEKAILSQGKKCVHRTHYLCHTKEGNRLPQDICPLEAVVANLYITDVKKKGSWAKVSGTYDLFVWFRDNQRHTIGLAEVKKFSFTEHISLSTVLKNSVLQGIKSHLCVQNLILKVVRVVTGRCREKNCQDYDQILKVVVEQKLIAFEYSLQPLCLPTCLQSTEETQKTIPNAPAVIKGKVVTKKGNPLLRVSIKAFDGINEYETKTNSEGKYFLPLYPDEYELVIAKSGYIAQTFKLNLSSGEIKSIDFKLEKKLARKGFRLKFQR